MVAMIFALLVLLIGVAVTYYMRYEYHNLKSKSKKSPFAMAYADFFTDRASSSSPLSRNPMPQIPKAPTQPRSHSQSHTQPHFAPPSPQPVQEERMEYQQPATPISDRPKKADDGLIEFYFEYRDEYKI